MDETNKQPSDNNNKCMDNRENQSTIHADNSGTYTDGQD